MKLALICQSYPPMVSGASQVVQRLAEGMVERGHHVLVLAASDQRRPYTDQIGRLKIMRLPSVINPFRVGQRGVLWSSGRIAKALRVYNPDIIHMHDPLNNGIASLVASRQLTRPIPKVMTIHAIPAIVSNHLPHSRLLRRLVEAGLWRYGIFFQRYFDAVIAPSETTAEIVHQHGYKKPTVICNGVDLNVFSTHPDCPGESQVLRAKYGLDPVQPVILYVGRVDADKQVDLLVRAAVYVFRSVDAQLLIVGSGRGLPNTIRVAERLGIRERCHFPGFIPVTGDLPGLYRLSTVFSNTSVIETQSCVVLEAAASALPIVAFRATCMPEFVLEGNNGLLAKESEPEDMAKQLIYLLEHPDTAKRMAHASLSVANTYSHENFLEKHEQLYRSLIGVNE